MNELAKEVSLILEKNDIRKEDMLDALNSISKNLEISLWEIIKVSPQLFYNLKDIVFYNLEHIPGGGEISGISNLRFLGSKFPNFIHCFNDANVIASKDIPTLLEEINTIIREWNKNWIMATLYTKSNNGWQGGENPSPLIIYNSRTESPSKYWNANNYGSILDANGNPMKKYDLDMALCGLDTPIGEYVNGQIFYNIILQFKKAAQDAIRHEKDLKIELETSNVPSW
jgi:hypothetical protein